MQPFDSLFAVFLLSHILKFHKLYTRQPRRRQPRKETNEKKRLVATQMPAVCLVEVPNTHMGGDKTMGDCNYEIPKLIY